MLKNRQVKVDDAPLLWSLLDKHKGKYLNDFQVLTPEWILELCQEPDLFVILNKYDIVVGCVWFESVVEGLHATAHAVIEPEYWRQVIKSEQIEEIVSKAFSTLNLRKLKAYPRESQKTAIRLLQRLGFSKVAALWDETLVNGKPETVLIYSVTSKAWKKKHDKRGVLK